MKVLIGVVVSILFLVGTSESLQKRRIFGSRRVRRRLDEDDDYDYDYEYEYDEYREAFGESHLECDCEPRQCSFDTNDTSADFLRFLKKGSYPHRYVTISCEYHVYGLSRELIELPPEISRFTNLRYLSLRGLVKGQVPQQLGSLSKLRAINFLEGKISGSIPNSIGKLKYLQEFSLEGETFSMPIPDSFFSLHELGEVVLKFSKPTGMPLDPRWGDTNVHSLRLELGLTGPLPVELGKSEALSHLELQNNNLAGPFPSVVANISGLEFLNIENNQFTGTVPANLSKDLPHLHTLVLNSNRFTGSLSPWLDGFEGSELRELWVSFNEFRGEIPAVLGRIPKLEYIYMDDNQLTGDMPTYFDKMPLLKKVYLDNNKFTPGRIPPFNFSHIHEISLANTRRVGEIPRQVSCSPKLQFFGVADNSLDGHIPPLPLNARLEYVLLQNNRFTSFQRPDILSALGCPAHVIPEQEVGDVYEEEGEPYILHHGRISIRVEGNPLVCDCHLIGWFSQFFMDDNDHIDAFLDHQDATLCANVNSFGGVPIALIREGPTMPCTHPQDLGVTSQTSTSFNLTWKSELVPLNYGQGIVDRALIQMNGKNNKSKIDKSRYCWDCSSLRLADVDVELGESLLSDDENRNPSKNETHDPHMDPREWFGLVFQADISVDGVISSKKSVCCSVTPFLSKSDNSTVHFQVSGLSPATEYAISVRNAYARFDVSSYGAKVIKSRLSSGPYALAIRPVTSEDIPQDGPSNVTLGAHLDTEATISWVVPTQMNGKLVKYQLLVFVVGSNRRVLLDHEKTPVVDMFIEHEFATIRNLSPGTSYVARIRAYTVAGHGPYSREFTFSTRNACGAGTEKSTNQSLGFICIPCQQGYYRTLTDAHCTKCPATFPVTISEGSTSSSDCTVAPGFFKDITVTPPIAKECLEGMHCNALGATSASVDISPGFWRESNASLRIIKCLNPNHCQQTSATQPYCTNHHTGVKCLACKPGYAKKGKNDVCTACTDTDISRDYGAIGGWAAILLFVALAATFKVCFASKSATLKMKSSYSKHADDTPRSSMTTGSFDIAQSHDTPGSSANHAGTQPAPEPRASFPDLDELDSADMMLEVNSPREAIENALCAGCNVKIVSSIDSEPNTIKAVSKEDSSVRFWHPSCLIKSLDKATLEGSVISVVQYKKPDTLIEACCGESDSEDDDEDEDRYEENYRKPSVRKLLFFFKAISTCFAVKARILLGFFQVYFAFYKSFDSGALAINSITWFAFIDVDVSALLNAFQVHCAWDQSHYDELLLYTITPIGFAVLVWVEYQILRCVFRNAPQSKLKAKTESITMILLIAFMVYPGVSRMIFSTFICETYPTADGVEVPVRALTEDPRLSCDSAERTKWEIYAGIMIGVYPLGIVLLYCFALYTIREVRYIPKAERSDQVQYRITRVRFLTRPYRFKSYWFEAYELVRKICQTTGLLFVVYATGSTQVGIFVAQLVTVIAIFVLQGFDPYTLRTDYYMAVISQFVLLTICVAALLDGIATSALNPVYLGKFNFSALVIAAFTLEMVAFVALVGYDMYLFYTNENKFRRLAKKRRYQKR
mmetsp:Transcript_4680/g.8302  ORF Transcript_4680/g.8302 Transcript_4680/m.8302 type:complete len:1578 (-) Transcript_4680:1925-6658(-)